MPNGLRAPFYKISCPDCSNKQLVFSRASTPVVCRTCGTQLATPTGGHATFRGDILETLN